MGWLGSMVLASLVFEQDYTSQRARMSAGAETPVYVIGLVGNAGAGKSTAARWLAQRGCDVVSADKLGHESYAPGTDCHRRIVDKFGPRVVAESGEIDRRALASLAFQTDRDRRNLEAIVWPEIERRIRDIVQHKKDETHRWQAVCGGRSKQSQIGRHCLVLEAAVAVEAGWTGFCDEVWLIDAPGAGTLQERLVDQRGMDQKDADRRLSAQSVVSGGASVAQIRDKLQKKGVVASIVSNAGTVADYARAVNRQWEKTTQRAGSALHRRCFTPSVR